MRYKYIDSTNQVVVRIDDDGKSRLSLYVGELSSANIHQREYMQWLDAGNTPEPADPEPVVGRVPTADEKIQALTDALINRGILSKEEANRKILVGPESNKT